MGFITLNRFGEDDCVFDPETVVQRVQDAFPNVELLPGDQLAMSAERAAAAGAADHVVRTLRRNQQEYGPAYAFEIPVDSGGAIQGRARRYDVTFLFQEPLAELWRQRLVGFLQSLGPGEIQQAPDVHRATENLA
jgi:hypothetical protein